MNKYSKIADGLASWLNFEKRAGRENLFGESYLAHPIGQLLQYRFPGKVQSEIEHPILSKLKEGAGRKPSIDFAINKVGGIFDLVIETKWISKSPYLLRNIIVDVVRLDLMAPKYAKEALLIAAGKKRDFINLFKNPQFQPHPNQPKSHYLLPIDQTKTSVRFIPIPKFREKLFIQVLKTFKDIEISKSIPMERSGPFPINANNDQYEVYIWRIRKYGKREQFKPKEHYKL